MQLPLQAVLSGTGSYVPKRIVRNEDFTSTIDTSDEWIRSRTGIRERRFAEQGETGTSMGLKASKIALEQAKLKPEDIDLIICATITPDWMTPSTANLIQTQLGCRHIPAFDLSAACTGFIYAVSVAKQFIATGSVKHALVLGSEVLSRVIDLTDRNTCILFGDGSGAAIFSASTEQNRGILDIDLHSDGKGNHLIRVPSPVTQFTPEDKPGFFLTMHGRDVFKFAVTKFTELLKDAIRRAAILGREIGLIVPHQVNQRIIDSVMESTGFPSDRVMINLDRYGNTSGASVPIALDEAIQSGRAKRGDLILLVGFGAGLTWGSTLLQL
jgi:3-oxoacyl-[acyl-carrier-protein] synthase III